MPKKVDITGLKFNRLSVIEENGKCNDGKIRWLCRCDCGKIVSVSGTELRSGGTKSCGCLASEFTINRNKKHGLSHLPEYKIWKSMKKRCYNKNELHYKEYGERGITVCDRWRNSFENFIKDMGLRPNKSLTLERIDNNGNYEPSNCRWATREDQANNRRFVKLFSHNGASKSIPAWAREFKIPATTLYSRVKVKPFDSVVAEIIAQ